MQSPREVQPRKILRSRALVTILVLSLVLAWLVLDRTGETNPLRDAFSRVISPIQYVLKKAVGPVARLGRQFSRIGSLAEDNDALERQLAQMRTQIALLQEAQIENETLRRQLNFKSAVPQFQLLSAEVIGHDVNGLLQYLIIDRGRLDGIERGMPVLTAEGLVGRISQVSVDSSVVMLITDPSSSISALIQRSRATGVVQGYPGYKLRMRYIPQGDTVEPGDVVLTSGLGGNFPKRLVIGQIASAKHEDIEMFQEAEILPAVNLRDLEVVMVLLNFAAIEMTPGLEE